MEASVVIIDHDSNTDPKEIAVVAAALTIQSQRDWQPHHGTSAVVRYDTAAKPGEWVMYLLKDLNEPGALGYHDETPDGAPIAKLSPPLDVKYDGNWSVTASHELLEMLLQHHDNARRAARANHGRHRRRVSRRVIGV